MSTEEQLTALGRAVAQMGAKPEFSAVELERWVREMGAQSSGGGDSEVKPRIVTIPAASPFPRLPIFNGDKGECTFLQWKNEVAGLIKEESSSVVLQAMRRSLRGQAAEVLLHLGEDPTVKTLLGKLQAVFGEVLSAEQLLEAFYSAKQLPKESVAVWGCRLEELVDKSRREGAIDATTADGMLRTKFWSGLYSPNVKMALRHTFERKEEFNGLLAEARAVEAEFHGTASVQVRAQQVDSEKLDLILQKVTALEARVLRVEEGQRPTTKTSKPMSCFNCRELGHFSRQCPYKGNGRGAGRRGDVPVNHMETPR